MVQILPLVGAAALFAQTALAAAVPVRRTYNYNSNNYNSGSNYNSGNQANVYQQSSNQDSNQYGNQDSNQYGNQYANQDSNQYANQDSNQYGNQDSNQYANQDSNQYGSGNSYNQYNNNAYQSTSTVEEMMMMATTTAMEMAMETSVEMMMMDTTTSSMMAEETQMMMDTTTSTMMAEETTVMQQEISTSTPSYSMPMYGSGSSNWNSGYNNCVQQCMAQFGAPPSTMTMESQQELPSATGAIHTILVAPEGAGLRYMPFAVNASIGDTIRYVWTTPNNHTATLSSALAVCNKSGVAEQRDFVSGVKNASAGMQIFDVTVQTSEPQFFYCSVAQHCQKGMFGIINPATDVGSPNSSGAVMSSLMQSNPQLQAAYSYMMQNVTGTDAEGWGMNINMSGIPQDQYEEVAANILFTQANFAANPGMIGYGRGAANPDGSPVQIVSGLNVLLSDTNATPSNAPSPISPVPSPTGSLTPVNATNGALSTRSVSTWVAVIVGVAGWLLI